MELLQLPFKALRYVRENSWSTIWKEVMRRDAHPFIQFCKYAACGLGAFFTHQAVWLAMSFWVFPCISSSIPDETRALNSTINNSVAVLFSTTLAYITNVCWVFTSGRHSRFLEVASFFGISLVSFGGGLLAGPWLIKEFGIHTIFAQISMAVTSMLINYVCRKFLIFKH